MGRSNSVWEGVLLCGLVIGGCGRFQYSNTDSGYRGLSSCLLSLADAIYFDLFAATQRKSVPVA
eukprot:5834989-Amphidinium_carterae.1